MSIRIRQVKSADFEGVLRLNRQFYSEASENPNFGDNVYLKMPTKRRLKDWFCRVLKQRRAREATYMVACNGKEIVGHCFIRPVDSPVSERSHVGNLSVFVSSGFRNQHVGRNLIRNSLTAAEGKFDIVQIVVMGNNPGARHLYRKLGFRKWGLAKGYVKRGRRYIDLEHMSRWI